MQNKIAFITGITGQDGAYLAEFLLEKNYLVHGLQRRASTSNTERIQTLHQQYNPKGQFFLHYGDMSDALNLTRLISDIRPREIYNLAAQSHVQVSFEMPAYTAYVDALGALHLLEAVRVLGLSEYTRIYQASTSELYGKVQEIPQKESTPFYPRSPYAAAKLYAYWMTINYREAYSFYASNGILFNHESPLREETFVTRKITRAVAAIYHGCEQPLILGNLEAKRDWGHARDYVEGMWLMLQQEKADDYLLATGTAHSVREFVELAFKEIGISLEWSGRGVEEVGKNARNGKVLVKVDPCCFRPTEVDLLIGDASKARQQLNWAPKVTFDALVKEMVSADIELQKLRIS